MNDDNKLPVNLPTPSNAFPSAGGAPKPPLPPTPPPISQPSRPILPIETPKPNIPAPVIPPRPYIPPPTPPAPASRPMPVAEPPKPAAFSAPAPTPPANNPGFPRPAEPAFTPPQPAAAPVTFKVEPAPRPMPPEPPKASAAPEISIRTMKSDLEALKASPEAQPKPFAPREEEVSSAKKEMEDLISGFAKEEAPRKSGGRKWLIVVGVLVFAMVIALLGYFVIFPYFFPSQPTVPPLPTVPSPQTSVPQTSIPSVQIPQATGTPPAGAPTNVSVPVAPKPHQSLLKTPASLQVSLNLTSVDLASLQQLLSTEAANKPASTNALKEINLSGPAGQPNFSDVLPLLLPEFTGAEVGNFFEDDFTTLLYYDANGAWPIWVAKVKAGTNVSDAQTDVAKLETSSGLANLFLTSPGTPNSAGFKTGQLNGLTTRYLTFSQKGASLNYAFVGNKLVISASFNGLKKVLANL